ncbi:MAG TPA: hypothetical protein VEL68_21530 [Thermodesulfobacteriota bacterium]|nr:hypothetical protein [Thermodesulfobacteriota bacterium]
MKGSPPKGGHHLDANAGPRGKGLGSKNHEASFISWAGSATRSRNPVEALVLVGATSRSPDRAPAQAEASPSLQE